MALRHNLRIAQGEEKNKREILQILKADLWINQGSLNEDEKSKKNTEKEKAERDHELAKKAVLDAEDALKKR